MVRLDAFLKNVGLHKSRSQAKRCCDDGRAQIAGVVVRPSQEVRVGDRLRVETETQILELEVLEVPQRPVARARRSECYRLISREAVAEEILSFDDDA